MRAEHCCWPECQRKPEADVPLCEAHYREVGLHFIDHNTFGGRAFQVIERRTQREAHDRLLNRQIEAGRRATAKRAELAARSVVYYVRTGRYVKIGFTSDLKARLSSLRLPTTAVLATEPGGRSLEAQRHGEFGDERIDPRREDFALSLRLQEHIRELREDHGIPEGGAQIA